MNQGAMASGRVYAERQRESLCWLSPHHVPQSETSGNPPLRLREVKCLTRDHRAWGQGSRAEIRTLGSERLALVALLRITTAYSVGLGIVKRLCWKPSQTRGFCPRRGWILFLQSSAGRGGAGHEVKGRKGQSTDPECLEPAPSGPSVQATPALRDTVSRPSKGHGRAPFYRWGN